MADNSGFHVSSNSDQEQVFATNVGDSSNPGTGEVTPLFRAMDASNVVTYTKMDGTAFTPSALETIDYNPVRVPIGHEVLVVGTSAVNLASIPSHAVRAEVQVHTGGDNVCWTTTGTAPDPTAGLGRITSAGNVIALEGKEEIANFSAISLAANGTEVGTEVKLYLAYVNVTEDASYAQ